MKPPADPLQLALERKGRLVLDGGLASALEDAGHDLRDALWSARVLRDAPEAISAVHQAYLEAGADIITTASYQASVGGFVRAGSSATEAEQLIQASVHLARAARDRCRGVPNGDGAGGDPLVAASIGPYGATLADGSEYRGDYAVSPTELAHFHRERLAILLAAAPDVLAIETIPSSVEAAVLAELLTEMPPLSAWLSFSCRDGAHLNDGTRLEDAVALCDASRLSAIGVNCTAPQYVNELIATLRAVTDLPIVVYPNRGDVWNAVTRTWEPDAQAVDWGDQARSWLDAGALIIGGCCRVGPTAIAALRDVTDEAVAR